MNDQGSTIEQKDNEELVKHTLLHVTWVESAGGTIYHQFFFVQDEEDAEAQVEQWRIGHNLPPDAVQNRELCPNGWPPDARGANEDHRHKGWILRPKKPNPIL